MFQEEPAGREDVPKERRPLVQFRVQQSAHGTAQPGEDQRTGTAAAAAATTAAKGIKAVAAAASSTTAGIEVGPTAAAI